MKKIASTLVALAVLAIPATAQAQNVTVNAAVNGTFRWSAGQSLEFGTTSPTGATANVTVPATQSTADASGRQAGYVELFFNSATTVTVTDVPESLAGSGANTLAVNGYSCGVAENTDDPAVTGFDETFASCGDGQGFTQLTVSTAARRVRLWFGGTILGTILDDAVADTYTGTITLTASQP